MTKWGSVRREAMRLAVAALAVTSLFLWERHLGLNISDEGYLWYGSWQTALGAIPGLDFQAYDPGRYYWIAAWSFAFGDTLWGVRAAVAVFQVLGVWLALSFLARNGARVWIQAVALLLLCTWMLPIHKLFEHTLSIVGVVCLARVAIAPRPATFFAAGLCIGVAGIFGKNHALYLSVALVILTFLPMQPGSGRLGNLVRHAIPGVCVGYLPMGLLMLFVPGFLGAMGYSLLLLIQHGATNLELPIPWPWSPVAAKDAARWLGGTFVFVGVAYPALLALGLRLRCPALVAACVVGIPYLHHAFARPDASHLAQSICPLILASALGASIPADRGVLWRVVGAAPLALLLGLTVRVALPQHLGYQALRGQKFVEVELRGERYGVHPWLAPRIEWASQRLAAVPRDEPVLILPTEAIFYAAFEREAPIWDLFASVAKTDAQQDEMIEAIQRADVRWALVRNRRARRQPATRFSSTHPKLYAWIESEFDLQDCWGDHCWYRRRASGE